jgi:hypothetical protein
LCWVISGHTRNSLIYSLQTTLIIGEALLHIECPPDKLLQYSLTGKLSYRLPLEFQFLNSHHSQQPLNLSWVTVGTSKSFPLGIRDWFLFCILQLLKFEYS